MLGGSDRINPELETGEKMYCKESNYFIFYV